MCPDAMRRCASRSFWDTDTTCKEIRSNFALLERAVAQFDTRFTLRALRSISSLRKRLTDRVLCTVIVVTYSAKNPTARLLIQAVGMEGEDLKAVADQHKDAVQALKNSTKEPLPEVDVYIGILLQVCTFLCSAQNIICQPFSVVCIFATTANLLSAFYMTFTDLTRYIYTTNKIMRRVPNSPPN